MVLMTCPVGWTDVAVRRYVEVTFRHLQVRVYRVIVRPSPPTTASGDCGWTVADVWLHRRIGAKRATEALNAMLNTPPCEAPGGGPLVRFLAANVQLDFGQHPAASFPAGAGTVKCGSSAQGSTRTEPGGRSAKKKRAGAGAHGLVGNLATAAVVGSAAAEEDLEVLRMLPYGFDL